MLNYTQPDRQFTKGNIEIIMLSNHTNVKNAQLQSTSDTIYTKHSRVHRREKPYKCEVCSAALNMTDTLKQYRCEAGLAPLASSMIGGDSLDYTVGRNHTTVKYVCQHSTRQTI